MDAELEPIADLVKHNKVKDVETSDRYYYLRVQGYGNATFFNRVADYPLGNVSSYDNGDLKVNIRRT